MTACACGCGTPLSEAAVSAGAEYIRNHQQRKARAGVARADWPKGKPMPPPRDCACGCGQQIPPKPFHRYKEPKFIAGHHRSVKRAARRINVPPDVQARTGFCECGCGQRTRIAELTQSKRGQYRGYPGRFVQGHHTRLTSPLAGRQRRDRLIAHGYVLVKAPEEHPRATKSGYIMEHRLVMEQMIGRYLEPHETVHHKNGDTLDNRPENLQLRSGNHGKGVRRQCGDCGSHNVVAVEI